MVRIATLRGVVIGVVSLFLGVTAERFPWAAIGDSFAAGPGAGGKYKDGGGQCMRRDGSYPAQLERDFPYPDNALQFEACTGKKVDHLIDYQLPRIDHFQRLVAVSIGGNNIGFEKILKACLFRVNPLSGPDCDEIINDVYRRRIDSGDFASNLTRAYEAITNHLTGDRTRLVLVQLYPNFFNQDTDWCNTRTFGIWPTSLGGRPGLTHELRGKLNTLGDKVRQIIIEAVQKHVREKKPPSNEKWLLMDPQDKSVYPNHRFCEPNHNKLDDPDVWFFKIRNEDASLPTRREVVQYDPVTCIYDPRYEDNFEFSWHCDIAQYTATLDMDHEHAKVVRRWMPEAVMQAFHPKTAAHTVIKNLHQQEIKNYFGTDPNHDELKLLSEDGRNKTGNFSSAP